MVFIEPYRAEAVSSQHVEIVERKGIGHPDTICDSVMESVSIALCSEYLRSFGMVLHHNIDKGLLAAGKTAKRFGGGRIVRPMELTIGDRATFIAGSKKIAVKEIAVETAKTWFRNNLRFIDPDRHVSYRVALSPGSQELTDIFRRRGAGMSANDTSAAVGYYPLSATETTVLELERYLNSGEFKAAYPETGEDVKVMALRRGKALDITIAMPFLARFIQSEGEYFSAKKAVHRAILKYLRDSLNSLSATVHLNTLDRKGRGTSGVYLSLLGTSAEDADSGQVGRGNRVNGLISINRPLGTEAAAGKNPVSHVGKIYNVLAHRIAQIVYEEVAGVREVYIMILSRIGSPVSRPLITSARILPSERIRVPDISRKITRIIERELAGIPSFCKDLSTGRYPVC